MTSDYHLTLNHRWRVENPERPGPRPQVGIDPRLHQRWVETRRHEGRRRLRVLLGVLGVGVLGGASWGATRSPLLDVDRVVVEGATRSGDRLVRSTSGIDPGQALLHVDPGAAARRIATLPWVLRVEVGKDWPGTVRVRVTERVPVAMTRADGGGWALLDRSGRVLAVVPEAPFGLAVVDGIPAAGAPGTRLGAPAAEALAVVTALPPALAPRVAAVAVGEADLSLRLAPQGEVRLGRPEAVAEELRAALTVLRVVDGRTVATIDVRIPTAPVLTRR